MKKVLLLLLSLVILYSFTKKSTVNNPPANILVCHYDAATDSWSIITIDENEWGVHAAHGDVRLDDQDGDGFVPNNECGYGQQCDCHDMDAMIKPGTTDIPNNAIDEDCNGIVSTMPPCVSGELEVTLPDGSTIYVYPTDNDSSIGWGKLNDDIDELANISTLESAIADFNGAVNTTAIVAELGDFNNGNYAAYLCANLSDQTGCDWYLPATGELNAMYQQLGPPTNGFDGSGEMLPGFYLSSTERDLNRGWFQWFFNGNAGTVVKNIALSCRCVRR